MNNDDEYFLIANIKNKKVKNNNDNYHNIKNELFIDKLKFFLNEEFNEIYFSNDWVYNLNKLIINEINELINKRICEDVIDKLINDIVKKENKFDFVIPFE